MKHLTSRPYGANFVLDFPIEDRLAVALEYGVPIVSFFWGDGGRFLPQVHSAGAFAIQVVGSVDEADAGSQCRLRRHRRPGARGWRSRARETGRRSSSRKSSMPLHRSRSWRPGGSLDPAGSRGGAGAWGRWRLGRAPGSWPRGEANIGIRSTATSRLIAAGDDTLLL